MKNWKYINGAEGVKIGNGWSGSFTDVNPGSEISNEVYKELKENNFDKAKTIDALSNKYKGIPNSKQYFKDVVEKVMKSYSNRTVNDTPAEYAKRPPKIVGGNSKINNALKYSSYSEAMSMWKQRDWSKTLAEKENGYSSPVREQIAIYKKDDTYYVMERQEAASKGMNNLEVYPIKRISNSLPEELEKDVEKKDKEKVDEVKKLEKDVEKKDKEKVDEVKKLEKVGNYSKGEVIYQQGSLKYIYGGETNGTHIVYEQPKGKAHTFSSEAEIKSWLRLGNKVGNALKYTNIEDARKKLNSDFVKAGNRQKYNPGDEVTVRLPGKGARRALVVRDEGNVIKVSFSENGPEVTALPSEVSNSKFGNSSSDDKFAYVMREFEEGKLKTPDGKVVTDPAQAKAIAYSESKKTENGLARARNAIKK